MRKVWSLLVLLLLIRTAVHSQSISIRYLPYLQVLAQKMQSPLLSYRYSVRLEDMRTKQVPDSASGVLYKAYGAYLDSNSLGISMVVDGHFFKADRRRKEAYLYNLAAVERLMGLRAEDMNNNLLNITDSLLNIMGKLSAVELSSELILTYDMAGSGEQMQSMVFRFNRKDMSIISIVMTVREGEVIGSGAGYRKVYTMHSFVENFDANQIKARPYYIRTNGKVELQGKIKGYKLNSFL